MKTWKTRLLAVAGLCLLLVMPACSFDSLTGSDDSDSDSDGTDTGG